MMRGTITRCPLFTPVKISKSKIFSYIFLTISQVPFNNPLAALKHLRSITIAPSFRVSNLLGWQKCIQVKQHLSVYC